MNGLLPLVLLAVAYTSLCLVTLIMFVADRGRLPAGSGELINYLLGLPP